MSNSSSKLSTASRAMIAGAMVGGGATVASKWQAYRKGDVDAGELAASAASAAVKAGVISGGTTYVAERMAGRPALSMLTLLSAGAASLYLADQLLDRKQNESS